MAADPFDPRRREPYVNSDGRRFQILGSGLVASERATLLLARLAGPELEQRIRAGLMSATECIAEEIRAFAEGKEEKGK